jgi:hypothetical protein
VDVVLLWDVGTTSGAAETAELKQQSRFAECSCRDLGTAVAHQGEVWAAAAGRYKAPTRGRKAGERVPAGRRVAAARLGAETGFRG